MFEDAGALTLASSLATVAHQYTGDAMTNEKQFEILADAILSTLISPNETDRNLESANVVDGLFAIARGLHHIGGAIDRLGNADAATPMGAVEALGVQIEKASQIIAGALECGREGR